MRNAGTTNKVKDWVRVAAKLSLLFTDPKLRATAADAIKNRGNSVSDTISDKYDDVSDAVGEKYEDAVSRLENAVNALRGRSHWASRVTGLLLGIGVGAGLGILLAPAAGWETRQSVREKAVDTKKRVFESASSAAEKIRRSVASMPSTGTEG
jgi:gas vesicle protein